MLEECRTRGIALGAFSCYDLITAVAVLRAAEERGAPVVLLVSAKAFASTGGSELVSGLRVAAERAQVSACVQLDHVSDPVLMHKALVAGVGAVMADGSRMGYSENAALVRAAVSMARGFDADVEAELGHVAGNEDAAVFSEPGSLTDPWEAATFVRETGAACLAVSIGNVHGHYAKPPELDWNRLDDIRSRVETPLSLHGASGLGDTVMRRAVSRGIAKINVNTELRQRYIEILEERLQQAQHRLDLVELHTRLIEAIGEVVAAKLDAYKRLPDD